MTTITQNSTTQVSYSSTLANPITVASTVTIDVTTSGAAALYFHGSSSDNWTVVNDGHLLAGSASNTGNALIMGTEFAYDASGTLTNNGTISGTQQGVELYVKSGTVINNSVISSTGTSGLAAIYIGLGNRSGAVASVINNSGGKISGYTWGIEVTEGAGTVTNYDTIKGTGTDARSIGVFLKNGGSIDNKAGIVTGYAYGVEIKGTAGTVTNAGKIEGYATGFGVGLILDQGGSLDNSAATATVEGVIAGVSIENAAGTVANSGSIIASGTLDGDVAITLAAGGSISNDAGGLIKGSNGIDLSGAAAAVTNNGTITSTGTSFAAGILDDNGSTIDNTDLIRSGYNGIWAQNDTATITNSGTIEGTLAAGAGIELSQGGSINNTGGLIQGDFGIEVEGSAGTVTNAAAITATGANDDAVAMDAGGYLSNSGAGYIKGAVGIYMKGGTGTVINAGTITGTSGDAIRLADAYVKNTGMVTGISAGIDLLNGGTVVDSGIADGNVSIYVGGSGNNLVELETGYSVNNFIDGSSSANNTAELVGNVASPLDVAYVNIGLNDFQDIMFGGNATLSADTFAGMLRFTVSDFDQTTDAIDLQHIGTGGTVAGLVNDVLTIVGSGTVTLQLDASDPSSATDYTTASDNANGTLVLIACFCRGTRILAERGQVPVEALATGERVMTCSGALRPIKWIGRRSYDGRFVSDNNAVLPVMVKAGAIGDGVPACDLHLSPHHALYLDGVLVPVECLINGVSIVQSASVERVDYFHIELASHDVILAEGTPVETFVDCDSRSMFHNAAEFALLYPGEEAPRWTFCAPRVEDDVRVAAMWRRLAMRAGRDPQSGPLQGHLDQADQQSVRGWARDAGNPDMPVTVEIVADGNVAGQVVANRYRPDLAAAGFGHGRHGFEFRLTAALPAERAHMIAARRAVDRAELAQSPRLVPAGRVELPRAAAGAPIAAMDPPIVAGRPPAPGAALIARRTALRSTAA